MPINQPVTAKNDEPDKVKSIRCNCDFLWSLAHQFSYLRLSDKVDENEYKLVNLYSARAKRIAATYARFYLETEEGGDPSKLGRYYWMALGAFASKTVACLLDSLQLQASYVFIKPIANGLGQGNLWLFTDISASHWLYNNYCEHFHEGMKCAQKRHVNNLEPAVKKITQNLPWADKSLGKIHYFQPSNDIIKGFQLVAQIEATNNEKRKRSLQLKHLLAVADHEQGAVLQPLIYDDPEFSKWTALERNKYLRWMSPKYELIFTHQCSERDLELKSVAPDDMIVEDLENRMDWIQDASETFHGLMRDKKNHMMNELQTMAGWVNAPDAALVY
ncbi:MAG: hypothetical protein GXP08_17875 [Gammaproteobacteria bacterium]|nr:hypothetical protein [Gammaproteobacteria bacterium]